MWEGIIRRVQTANWGIFGSPFFVINSLMKTFSEFLKESSPMSGVHPEVWRAHERHIAANKKHYETGLGIYKSAATRTFQTLKKKLKKYEPNESKHLKIMQDMMDYSEKRGDL
jgi:hypothetical protein